MNAEETEIVAGANAGDYQLLLGLGGGGLFDHCIDAIQAVPPRQAVARHGAELRQQRLARGLHAGHGAFLALGNLHHLQRAGLAGADVDMVADHVQKGVAAHEVAGAVDGVAVAERLLLGDESDRAGVAASGLDEAALIAGPHHYADFFHLGGQGLLDENAEHRLLAAIAIDQGLQGKRALVGAGRGDHRLLKSQVIRGSWKDSVTDGGAGVLGWGAVWGDSSRPWQVSYKGTSWARRPAHIRESGNLASASPDDLYGAAANGVGKRLATRRIRLWRSTLTQ